MRCANKNCVRINLKAKIDAFNIIMLSELFDLIIFFIFRRKCLIPQKNMYKKTYKKKKLIHKYMLKCQCIKKQTHMYVQQQQQQQNSAKANKQ